MFRQAQLLTSELQEDQLSANEGHCVMAIIRCMYDAQAFERGGRIVYLEQGGSQGEAALASLDEAAHSCTSTHLSNMHLYL